MSEKEPLIGRALIRPLETKITREGTETLVGIKIDRLSGDPEETKKAVAEEVARIYGCDEYEIINGGNNSHAYGIRNWGGSDWVPQGPTTKPYAVGNNNASTPPGSSHPERN